MSSEWLIYIFYQGQIDTVVPSSSTANAAGHSSPETVISVAIDSEANDDDTIIADFGENAPTSAVSNESVVNMDKNPDCPKGDKCKGKYSAKKSCSSKEAGSITAQQKLPGRATSTRGAALNILDVDLLNDVIDTGMFFCTLYYFCIKSNNKNN